MGYVFKVQNDKTLTCPVFDNFDSFPKHQKLAKIQLTNGMYKYILLDEIIAPYDSGVRYQQQKKIYQVNTSYAYNIFDVKFANEIYYLNLQSIDYACFALRNVFDSRVNKNGDYLYFTSPRKELGIRKMLIIGLNVEVSYIDSYDDNAENRFTISTYNNGWCNYMHKNYERHKGKAMLIQFDPNRIYRIKCDNSLKDISYTDDEVKNCIFFGKGIEELPNVSANYTHLFHTNNFFTTNPETLQLENYKSARCRKELIDLKEQLGRYAGHQYIYNFYNLNDLKFF